MKMQNGSGRFTIFPYSKWRTGQREAAEAVYRSAISCRVLLLEYPTGAGKTVAALVGSLEAALDKKKKIFYLARTKNQAQAPFRELKRMQERNGEIKAVVLRNRRDMCAIRYAGKMSYKDFLSFCKLLREHKECRFYDNALRAPVDDLEEAFKSAHSPLDFIGRLRSAGVCPCEAARRLVKNANIVIGSYNYIFDHETRKAFLGNVKLSLRDIMVIIDEAHNLPANLSETYSVSLSIIQLRQALKEARNYLRGEAREALERAVNGLGAVFREIRRSTGKWVALTRETLMAVTPSPGELAESVSKLIAAKYASEGRVESQALRVYEFIDKVYSKHEGYVLYCEEGSRLVYKCVVPAVETEEIFSGLYSAVLMSGTMPPRQYMVSLLGINPGRVDEVRLKGMVPESNRETVIVDRVTTRYRERSERMYSLIARYVKAVYDAIDSGVVLVVFPSYEVMKLVFEHVDVDEAVIEREDTDIEEVEAKVVKAGRILVFSVAGGKIVEGIEFRIGGRSLVKAVVIAGMPFPEPNIYNNALYRYLINKLRDRDTAWDLVFAVPAVVRMRQAAGRAIRSPEDRAVIVVLDRRFLKKRYLNYGEELARTVKLISDPDRLKVEIKNFLEGRG